MEQSEDIPRGYGWLVAHRRVVLAVTCGVVGFVALVISWIGVANTVIVPDQLAYISSGGLIGLFLVAVAGIAYWGEQRQRELARLGDIEAYLGAMATALGLTDTDGETAEARSQGSEEKTLLLDA